MYCNVKVQEFLQCGDIGIRDAFISFDISMVHNMTVLDSTSYKIVDGLAIRRELCIS